MSDYFESLCQVSYESAYLDDWGKADPQDKEEHKTLVAAVLCAQEAAA